MRFVRFAVAAAASLTFAPASAEDVLETFTDFTVGCDNGRACHAVGQYAADNFDLISVSIARGAGANDVPAVWFRMQDKPAVDLAADGKLLGVRFTATDDDQHLTPATVWKAIGAFRSSKRIELIGADGKSLGRLSTAGAAAAMLYMDDKQHRIGTVTALVRKGPQPAAAVPPPPRLPTVVRVSAPGRPPAKLSDTQIRAIQQQYAECTDDDLTDRVDYARLDARHGLILVTAVCGSGAYNMFTIPLIVDANGRRTYAKFDRDETDDMSMNISWDARARILSAYMKGRGIGDCGGGTEFVWNGARFVTVKSTAMDDCRGATEWITLYRARIVDK